MSSTSNVARICVGKIGSSSRKKPYTPIFDISPVRTIAVEVGASEYVEGSHPCNGINGTFTASPRNTHQNKTIITAPSFRNEGRIGFTLIIAASFPSRTSSAKSDKLYLPVI